MTTLIAADYMAYLADKGLTATIKALMPRKITTQELALQVNAQKTFAGMNLTEGEIMQYIADIKAAGIDFHNLHVADGGLPTPITRPAAPAGMGQNAAGVWFTTPNTGSLVTIWYVNGVLKKTVTLDVSTNRTVLKTQLGCVAGDVVQVGISDNDEVGWWGRITIT